LLQLKAVRNKQISNSSASLQSRKGEIRGKVGKFPPIPQRFSKDSSIKKM
jgi:hypothetical protein